MIKDFGKQESQWIEYKGNDYTRSYLKTVSVFANYHTGTIVFGVADDGTLTPIENPKDFCEIIENQINDSLKPHPDFSITVNENSTISLIVYKGDNTPYLYHGTAYKRNDTASIEVDDFELRRLILQGTNKDFEETKSNQQNLTFHFLGEQCKEKVGITQFNQDTLKTLNLYSEKYGYNVAASLLSDINTFPGLDVVVFGENENIIKERYDYSGTSILKQYYEAIRLFERVYTFEEIQGSLRTRKEKIPEEAFREAIANALIHRVYDVRTKTKVAMHNDSIEVVSPGGLPQDISKEEYLSGSLSSLRNPILANVFYRLDIIEAFATGIKRIKHSYQKSFTQPVFDIQLNSIRVILPLLVTTPTLTKKEKEFVTMMEKNVSYSRNELQEKTGLSKDSLLRVLKPLIDKGIVRRQGQSTKTRYVLIYQVN